MLSTLLDKFKNSFPEVNRIQLKNMFVLLICILDKETVCLYKLKKHVPVILGNTQSEGYAHYKRLLRTVDFWSGGDLWENLLLMVMGLLNHQVKYLLLDGTKWEMGSIKFHFMTLCAVYRGVSIPIYWIDLKKKGHSSQKERKQLLERALRLYRLEGKTLIADREYIGLEWFGYLVEHDIDFIVRLKKNVYRSYIDQSVGDAYSKMEKRALKRKHGVGKTVTIQGRGYRFVIVKNGRPNAEEPLLYLLSTLEKKHVISQAYQMRWLIEVCFYHLKSNGFQLENLAVKQGERTRLMMAIAVLAYVLAVHEGLKKLKDVRTKHHKDYGEFPEVSVFRSGLDTLAIKVREIVLFLDYLINQIRKQMDGYRSKKCICSNFVQ